MAARGPVAHMPQLDGLRGIAAVAVVLHHNLWRDGTLGDLRAAAHLGEAGVRLFFVLSGFLITGILLRARGAEGALRSFYARRLLRIFPLYYLVVISVAALGQPLMRAELGWNLAYLANFRIAAMGGFPGPPVSHLWTLSVEEQFYLLWPLVVLFAPRRSLLPIALSTLLLAPLSRLLVFLGTGNEAAAAVVPTSCLDTLGVGAALALSARVPRGTVAAGLALLVAATAFDGSWFDVVFRDTGYAAVFVALVRRGSEGARGGAGRFLSSRPLAYLGTISYGIYVYHHVLPALVRLPGYGVARTAIALAATLPLAAVSFHLFEAPVNSLKSRFPYRRPQAASRPADPVAA